MKRLIPSQKPNSRISGHDLAGMTTSTGVPFLEPARSPRGPGGPLLCGDRAGSCDDCRVPDASSPQNTRRARLWAAAESRGIPLRAILTAAAVVVLVYVAAKLLYRLRDVILLVVMASFIAVLLNPLVVALQRWKIKRRGLAVTVVVFWGLVVFFGLALAFGYPLANAITHLADNLPRYVSDAEHGRGWLGHLVVRYNIQHWVTSNVPKLVNIGQGLTKPALTLGKGALTLVVALFTIFVL